VRGGLDVEAVHPPRGGRAPGWHAGIVVARRQEPLRDSIARDPVAGARAASVTSSV